MCADMLRLFFTIHGSVHYGHIFSIFILSIQRKLCKGFVVCSKETVANMNNVSMLCFVSFLERRRFLLAALSSFFSLFLIVP